MNLVLVAPLVSAGGAWSVVNSSNVIEQIDIIISLHMF